MRIWLFLSLVLLWTSTTEAGAADSGSRRLSSSTPATFGTGARLAALDLDDSLGLVEREEAQYLSDAVRASIRDVLPVAHYVMMTRENIFELLPEDVDLASCVGSCAVEAGRRIGCDYIVTGRITRLAGEMRVSLELHDTRSANLLAAEQVGATSTVELEPALRQAAAQLALVLPDADRDHHRLAQEDRQRHREATAGYARRNRYLLLGAAAAALTGTYFHVAADADHDDHLDADGADAAVSTWDDYEANISRRNVAIGVAGVLVAWRLYRMFGGPGSDVEYLTLGSAETVGKHRPPMPGISVAHTVRFSW